MAIYYSGQIAIPTSGVAVQGPHIVNPGGFYLKAHPDNTDTVWVGNDGYQLVIPSGFPLNAGEYVILSLNDLSQLWFNTDIANGRVCWIRA